MLCNFLAVSPLLILNYNLLSGEAESGLERLHQCAEKELQQFLSAEGQSKEFNDFRTKLAGLTRYIFLLIFRIYFVLVLSIDS